MLGRGEASMEGRAIARPNAANRSTGACGDDASMEGRAIARPNWESMNRPGQGPELQWRAEQLLGQTRHHPSQQLPHSPASMEGRAIARPNRRRHPHRPHPRGGFNGGPSNCSAKPLASTVRPTCGMWRFNGGPSNCSAKPASQPATRSPAPARFNGGPSNCSAKRGGRRRPSRRAPSFNGGPSNCSAKRSKSNSEGRPAGCFNGGPSNCSAKPVTLPDGVGVTV